MTFLLLIVAFIAGTFFGFIVAALLSMASDDQ